MLSSKMQNRLWLVANVAFVATLAVPLMWISSAYAAHLNAIGVVVPSGAFEFPPAKDTKVGQIVNLDTAVDFRRPLITTEFAAPLVVNSETFMVRWLNTVKTNKRNLLWSSYPASIRGQVFSNKPAGGDPFSSGGW